MIHFLNFLHHQLWKCSWDTCWPERWRARLQNWGSASLSAWLSNRSRSADSPAIGELSSARPVIFRIWFFSQWTKLGSKRHKKLILNIFVCVCVCFFFNFLFQTILYNWRKHWFFANSNYVMQNLKRVCVKIEKMCIAQKHFYRQIKGKRKREMMMIQFDERDETRVNRVHFWQVSLLNPYWQRTQSPVSIGNC